MCVRVRVYSHMPPQHISGLLESRVCWHGARVHLLGCVVLTLPCVSGCLECRRITLPLFSMLARAALCVSIYRAFFFFACFARCVYSFLGECIPEYVMLVSLR